MTRAGRPRGRHEPVGYVTLLRGDLGADLADVPTKRRYRLPSSASMEPDTAMLGHILEGLDEL